MNKIDELKWKMAEQCEPFLVHSGFVSGFDAAMDLQLPVKFMKWLSDAGEIDLVDNNWYFKEDTEGQQPLDESEIFSHWLENIYENDK